ncbi:MAG: CDP-alcohol phosphatidyltransferase family protein [Oscillospiraceae bacterium]|nr:CDP-alcohol phosphatidyltransferase family protein [Oscillospiraceae bacterium]
MKHIPNMLTLIRIVLIPFFAVYMLQGQYLQAGIILVLSGLSDVLDGFLARHFGWTTYLGRVLDPVADKLTQGTVCIVMSVLYPQYIVFFVVMIAKEVTMLVMGGYLFKKGAEIEASRWFGKAATVVFYTAMVILVVFPQLQGMLVYALLGITTALVLFAFVMYVPLFLQCFSRIQTEKGKD